MTTDEVRRICPELAPDEAERLAEAVNRYTPCPDCGGEVGHRINCPRGIAFTGEEAEARRWKPATQMELKRNRRHIVKHKPTRLPPKPQGGE